MRSGKMRYRVRIQRPTREDERRGSKVRWQDVHVGPDDADGKVWAAIRTRRIAESPTSRKQLQVIGTYEVRLWAVPELDETWRLLHQTSSGTTVYNIVSADPPRLTSNELVLTCKRDKLKEPLDAS